MKKSRLSFEPHAVLEDSMLQNTVDNSSASFTEADLRLIRANTFVQQVEFHRRLDSTNDLALKLADRRGLKLPLLVLAETQTAGRGRRANSWWSTDGALTFSLLLESSAARLPTSRWPQVSLTAGLAVCEALEELLPSQEVRLKWPNDVYVNQRKISGILIEAPRSPAGRLVVGVGININNSLNNAPQEIAITATSMCDAAGKQFRLADVLIRILDKLARRLEWIDKRDGDLRERWRKRCMLTNHQVQIGDATGLCQGIDDEGALVLQTGDGLKRCFAGSVKLLDQ